MTQYFSGPCPICGGTTFTFATVLWPELVDAWQLADYETDYINRQQGVACTGCHNNLRTMALAAAILRRYAQGGTLAAFCDSGAAVDLVEINTAGNLTSTLRKLTGHRLVEYPEYDMMNLSIASGSVDLVVHSDTLEHIPIPSRALSECRRILRAGGCCIFTVPVVVDRLTRSRDGLVPSYHGQSGVPAHDQVVFSEFGADFWKCVLAAGFSSCEIFCLEYPSALAIVAEK